MKNWRDLKPLKVFIARLKDRMKKYASISSVILGWSVFLFNPFRPNGNYMYRPLNNKLTLHLVFMGSV
jgi:hypothetical protein